MSLSPRSSRQRFLRYREALSRPRADAPEVTGDKRGRRRHRSALELVLHFYALLKGQRLAVAFALATLTCSTVLALVPPAATKFVVDYVLDDRPLPETLPAAVRFSEDRWTLLMGVIVFVVVVSFLKIGLHIWGRWHATRATKRLQLAVRRKAFEHAVRLPLNRVHELRSGGVASVLREDAGSVAELIFSMIYNPWRAVVQLFGSFAILAWVDWRLLAGALLLLPLVYVTHRTWIRRIRPRYRDIRAQRENIDARTTEAFGGMRVVRAFGRQRSEAARFIRDNNLMARLELFVWWWSRIIEMIWDALIPLASAGLLLYGGWQVLHGQLTLGDLMMFLVYLLMLLEPLAVLAQSAAQFQNSLSGLDRILDLLAEPREMLSDGSAVRVHKEQVQGRLTLQNVGLRYPGATRFAVRGVTLEVPAGSTIALVGPSGAGKTTLCNLVARFFDPTEGRVLLDGRDLRTIDVESYRGLLGVVEQDVFLFDGTVAENIGYADRHATLADIRRAAQVAHAEAFIRELPDGYDTLIGERGVKLSGGQRQRIAIARAVLADPRILILDEATSNLDTESERLIQSSLKSLMRHRTCFVIAHRLSTIMHADRIVVLEDGRVVEVGTPEQLLDRDGRFRAMVHAQVTAGLIPLPASETN